MGKRKLTAWGRRMAAVAAGAAGAAWLGAGGCGWMPGEMKGDIAINQPPVVEFANVPADSDTFSFAPVIYWKGRDADGFVESYSYADITDATALSDPEYYIDFIPEEAWVSTTAMSDTVYLLTESGRVTPHVFYLKCVDDRGAESEVIYRRFFRANHPPRVPVIRWFTEPDYTYATDIPHPDSTKHILSDTLYCLDDITLTWSGLGFNWKSSDPDDSELYSIPLEYRYYLERVPHDTVWEWVSPGWSRTQEVRFWGLETGHYVFTVWARDDGFERSVRPATATFDVYRPSFEKSVLLLNTTDMAAPGRRLQWNLTPGDAIAALYQTEVARQYPDADYLAWSSDMKLWKRLLGRYRLVIWFSENQSKTVSDDDLGALERRLVEYVNIGGRLWVVGLLSRRNMISNNTLQLASSSFGGPGTGVSIPSGTPAEFAGAISGVADMPDLGLDTSRTGAVWRRWFTDARDSTRFLWGVYPLLPGVDIIRGGQGVETVYYFKSYTDTASGDVHGELAEVRANVGSIYYPPTATDCIIALQRNRVSEVTRVENVTRGVMGTPVSRTNNVTVGTQQVCIVRVSYPVGEPWSVGDSVLVDYQYLPFSESHMSPCAIRYERVSGSSVAGFEVLYRVAVFTFPLYYIDNRQGQVRQVFRSMLNWFFLPYAH